MPPRVEYSLSAKGAALLPILKMLSNWSVEVHPEFNFETCHITTLNLEH